jgi:putative transposase
MPRTARVVLPHCPHHIIQRRHNGAVVFVNDADYAYYLDNLRTFKETFHCCVHALCLMPNQPPSPRATAGQACT